MDEVTQQNAALVEEAAAGSLEEQAKKVSEVVGVFQINVTQAGRGDPVARAVAGAKTAPPAAVRTLRPVLPARQLASSVTLQSDWEEF
jgi:methyl-accepting chemotaxis protein